MTTTAHNLPRKAEHVVFVELAKDGTPHRVYTQLPGGGRVRQYGGEFVAERGKYVFEETALAGPLLYDAFALWWAPTRYDVSRVWNGRTGRPFAGHLKGRVPRPDCRVPGSHKIPVPGGRPFRLRELPFRAAFVARPSPVPEAADGQPAA